MFREKNKTGKLSSCYYNLTHAWEQGYGITLYLDHPADAEWSFRMLDNLSFQWLLC